MAAAVAGVLMCSGVQAISDAEDPYDAPLATGSFPVDPEASTIAKCFESGSGVKDMKLCITTRGNISLRWGGRGLLSDYAEGYAVCTGLGIVHGYDSGDYASAWGASSITYPSSTTVLVSRTTSDGKLKLDMKYSRDTAEYDVTIQTTITNVSGATLKGVHLTRYAGSLYGYAARTDFSVWSADNRPQYSIKTGVMLRGISAGGSIGHGTTLNIYDYNLDNSDWQPQRCISVKSSLPTDYYSAPGVGIRSIYFVGDLNPGAKKTVKHAYSRM